MRVEITSAYKASGKETQILSAIIFEIGLLYVYEVPKSPWTIPEIQEKYRDNLS
jgi:hypothetical protein